VSKDREFCVDFIDVFFLKKNYNQTFVASKVLNTTKNSTAQRFIGVKGHFSLLKKFVYAIQTQHGQAQKKISLLDKKTNFQTNFYYFKICL
jgi:hypothetical protein